MMKQAKFEPLHFWICILSLASVGNACSDPKQDPQILRPRETVAGLSVPYDKYMPPLNPYLADSPWPMMHQGPYNQASSPFPGPETSDALASVLVETGPSMAHLYAPIVENEEPLIWGSNFSDVYLAEATVEGATLVADLKKDGGIYVVTSKSMARVQWTGKKLSLAEQDGAWRSDYETGPDKPAPGRLGTGSGSTPTVMGIKGEDRFIVISDGQTLMHIVLFWSGAIPADWEGLGGGISRRIAAQVPITFGRPETTTSISEQSVLVHAHRAVVVNNDYGPNAGSGYRPVLKGALSYGVEQFVWDPASRTLRSSWANPDVPCPNGIPGMSAYSKMMYCVGRRAEFWTVEALDWETGKLVFSHPIGEGLSYNSVYAATEIGPERNIITGAAGGFVDVRARK